MNLNFLKPKQNLSYALQISEAGIKAVCWSRGARGTRLYKRAVSIDLSQETGDNEFANAIKRIMAGLGYAQQPLAISLPRNMGTSRFLRIPARTDTEISQILSLQASRYLPYPPEELFYGYSVLEVDSQGYSLINATIVHKDTVERILSLVGGLKPVALVIAPSFWGLEGLLQAKKGDNDFILVLDADLSQVELSVLHRGKVYFSRAFKYPGSASQTDRQLFSEVEKTIEAFSRETGLPVPSRIIVTGAQDLLPSVARTLKENSSLPIDVISCLDLVKTDKAAASEINPSGYSYASLMGFDPATLPDQLLLLPERLKEQRNSRLGNRKILHTSGFILLAIAFATAGVVKSMDNKRVLLGKLKSRIALISEKARPLEVYEDKILQMQNRERKNPGILEMIRQLYLVTPQDISISSFSYDDNGIVIRGQTAALDPVLEFTQRLNSSEAFKGLSAGIRYATRKATVQGELIDFEIFCQKAGK